MAARAAMLLVDGSRRMVAIPGKVSTGRAYFFFATRPRLNATLS
jgi:hypothetical protein